jgi:hypothetical protein
VLLSALAFIALSAFDETHQKELAANPPDLRFVLATVDGQRRFHPGESIPITLSFSSDSLDKYILNAARTDRSGRLWSEEFFLDRSDAVDPLAQYYGAGILGMIGGGPISYPVLNSEPERIQLFLNNWFRFDKPGVYRLFLKSHRLRLAESGRQTPPFAAVSNILEIEITPLDTAWQSATLAAVRANLDSPDPRTAYKAQRALEDLGTTEALRLLLQRVAKNPSAFPTLPLIRSPDRQAAIRELDAWLTDPGEAFEAWPVTLRAFFDYLQRYPQPLVPTSAVARRGFDAKPLQPELEKRFNEFKQMASAAAARLIPSLAAKDPAVRKECILVIGQLAPDEAKAAGLIEADDYGLTRAELIAGFDGFSNERKLALLSKKWDLISGPEMLPSLRKILDHAPPASVPIVFAAAMLGSVEEFALYRLKQLAPDEEKNVLLDDVTRRKPRFGRAAMRELPAQDLAKADTALAANLKADTETALSAVPLAAKFGTRRLLQPMLALYKGPVGPCFADQWFVAYFARVDAEQGKRILAEAMAAREHRGCFQSLLSDVSSISWNAVVEQQAITSLNDPDQEVATNAAATLAAFGGKNVQGLLLKRLEKWSRDHGHDANQGLGSALFQALEQAQAWVVDPPLAQHLADLCADDACRQKWTNYQTGPVRIERIPGLYGFDWITQVGGRAADGISEIEERMQLYPAATVFHWCLPETETARPQIENFANKHQLTLLSCPKQETAR